MTNKSGFLDQATDVVTLTAARTVTKRDSGKIFVSGAADVVITLPAASLDTKGMFIRCITSTLSTVTGFSLSPNSADKIQGTGITAADNKDLINTAATDAVGDSIMLVCDGVDGWWIASKIGTWAREA